jgi:hypothetical protein
MVESSVVAWCLVQAWPLAWLVELEEAAWPVARLVEVAWARPVVLVHSNYSYGTGMRVQWQQ